MLPAIRAAATAATAAGPSSYGYDPTINPPPAGAAHVNQTTVTWPPFKDIDTWVEQQDLVSLRSAFERDGYVVVRGLVEACAQPVYLALHDELVSGGLMAPGRHDLGAHEPRKTASENVGQLMWPSDLAAGAREGPLHQRGFALARALVGDDAAFDFDMLIWKDAHTDTATPWHQDEGYWPSGMLDKRALTVWTALDAADASNGAMCHILTTDAVSEATPGAVPVPLAAGDAVVWHGRTAHYSRGNSSPRRRRTFIANFRPVAMVQWEREHGFDHLRKGFEDYDNQKARGGDAYARHDEL